MVPPAVIKTILVLRHSQLDIPHISTFKWNFEKIPIHDSMRLMLSILAGVLLVLAHCDLGVATTTENFLDPQRLPIGVVSSSQSGCVYVIFEDLIVHTCKQDLSGALSAARFGFYGEKKRARNTVFLDPTRVFSSRKWEIRRKIV
jgi:hypothetical protein